ncbi:hypothetical protein MA16_Dca021240 [Dendrobium catenatum]|uniref:Uncharacterized protein n=1 Tax=Dendrobium catenatum TaxID=906689 RepID=A0A2I0VV41_9ASPA|nr:hypothetical protein MA16_Dca021240 [Dendrobium catenatum]
MALLPVTTLLFSTVPQLDMELQFTFAIVVLCLCVFFFFFFAIAYRIRCCISFLLGNDGAAIEDDDDLITSDRHDNPPNESIRIDIALVEDCSVCLEELQREKMN